MEIVVGKLKNHRKFAVFSRFMLTLGHQKYYFGDKLPQSEDFLRNNHVVLNKAGTTLNWKAKKAKISETTQEYLFHRLASSENHCFLEITMRFQKNC